MLSRQGDQSPLSRIHACFTAQTAASGVKEALAVLAFRQPARRGRSVLEEGSVAGRLPLSGSRGETGFKGQEAKSIRWHGRKQSFHHF